MLDYQKTIDVHVRFSPMEIGQVKRKMEQMGIYNMSAFIRKMSLDGYCVNLDLSSVKEMVRLLGYCSNNLNQYARVANSSGLVDKEDIDGLRSDLEKVYALVKELLVRLSQI